MADKRFIHKKNAKNALKILLSVTKILDKYDIAYYLDFGTLIGAVREKGFIPWDDDIDISILDNKDINKIPEVLKEIKKELKYRTYLITFEESINKRYKDKKTIYHNTIDFAKKDDYQIAKIRSNKFWRFGRGATKMDIFFKYEKDGYLYWFADGQVNRIAQEFVPKDLIEIDFYNIKCKIPKNYDEYLTNIYGDWKTPNKEWIEKDGISIVKGNN